MSAREDPVDETPEGQPQPEPMPGQMPEREEGRVERFIDNLEPRRVSRWLFWAIVVFFVVFLVWAALAEIDRTVRGQGRVISSNELQVVSSLEGGVLEEILRHHRPAGRSAGPGAAAGSDGNRLQSRQHLRHGRGIGNESRAAGGRAGRSLADFPGTGG